jgi:REP element-mobilizing transposase RayT
MYENFSGCRALAYCFMSNHLHLLLEVPPMAKGGRMSRWPPRSMSGSPIGCTI